MESTIKITGGIVTLKPFVDRKTFREYHNAMYKGVGSDLNNEDAKIILPLSNMEDSRDVLVLGCISKIVINENEVPITSESLERFKQRDFVRVLEACNKLLTKDDEEKKTLSKEPQPTS
jgi:hypothetical protein